MQSTMRHAALLATATAVPRSRYCTVGAFAAAPSASAQRAAVPRFAVAPARAGVQPRAVAAPLLRPARRAAGDVCVRATEPTGDNEAAGSGDLLTTYGSNLTFFLTWAGLVAYAALFSPNQTPLRDQYFLEKALSLGADDGVPLNAVFFCLFNIMGVLPALYASLLLPAGRSGNGVPAWPFVTGSFALGAFSLLPFFALWRAPARRPRPARMHAPARRGPPEMRRATREGRTPPAEPPAVPTREELSAGGPGALFQRAFESRAASALLLLAATGLAVKAATAGGAAWTEYGRLFNESRFVHITTCDFITLSLLMPYWVQNDAQARPARRARPGAASAAARSASARGRRAQVRKWDSGLLPLLMAVPVLGPALYLVLRPRAE